MNFEIVDAHNPKFIPEVRRLFSEYADSLNVPLDFQNFDEELKSLPGDYAPPSGSLLLAISDQQFAGCVAMRPLENNICEMKRLFVRPQWRGTKVGRILAETIMQRARDAGYQFMRLDTLPSMQRARGLYASLGFYEIKPYRFNPIAGTSFMEVKL
ncbi:MAG TPA: GNAT family N-acetyltransferase [Acidobacteriota bacterium]|nr:GNAT family N-acetyltransferase [Acidobacteriota bacterium]